MIVTSDFSSPPGNNGSSSTLTFYYTILNLDSLRCLHPCGWIPSLEFWSTRLFICIYRNSLTQRPQAEREKTWTEFLKTQIPLWLGSCKPEDTLFLRKWGHTRAPNFSQPSPRATARFSLWDVPGSSVSPPNSSAQVASALISGRKTIPPHLTPHSLIKGSGLTKCLK